MFAKKSTITQLPSISKQSTRNQSQIKQLNHQFFLLVRENKYQQAYKLGTMYLKFHPQNQAIQQFCHFIENNRLQLLQMVDEEMNYTDESSDEDQDEDQDDSDDETESRASSVSSKCSAKSSLTSKSLISQPISTLQNKKILKNSATKLSIGKQNTQICKGHKWDHNCKNKNCPNKKKI